LPVAPSGVKSARETILEAAHTAQVPSRHIQDNSNAKEIYVKVTLDSPEQEAAFKSECSIQPTSIVRG